MDLIKNAVFWSGVWLTLVNIVGFAEFGIDKKRARRGQWRISEKTLWITAVIGGSLGCFLGMKVFRHKTKHKRFYIGIPCLLCLQVLAVVLIFQYL